jgi:hypothetical protein
VAYLKLANDLGRAVGDKMLKRVAKYVAAAGFYIYGRFSQGDEVIAYHHSAEDGLRAIAKISELLSSHELVTDLPMAIDFGRATHHEVAATYLRLLHEGWRPKAGRSPKKVFFDIALKIAETRSEIRKVYDRAYLLYLYYESVHDQNSDRTHLHYKAFKRQVTRGKLVEPTRSWLTMSKAKREGLMLEKSLALVSQLPPDADLFDRVVVEVAKSIFLAKH